MPPYQLQQELLNARTQLETQTNQILSLEAALVSYPLLDASVSEKDKLIADQTKTIQELEVVVREFEESLARSLIAAKEDVEKEWKIKLDAEVQRWEEKEKWVDELVKELGRERRARMKLEDERRALIAFVSKFDSLHLGGVTTPKSKSSMSISGGPASILTEKQQNQLFSSAHYSRNLEFMIDKMETTETSMRLSMMNMSPVQPSLLDQVMPEEKSDDDGNDADFDVDSVLNSTSIVGKMHGKAKKLNGNLRNILVDKENVILPPPPPTQ